MIGALLYLTFHLQIVLGMSPVYAGLASLPITAGIMITVPLATRLLNQIGPRRQLIFGPVTAAVGVAYLSFITVDGGYWTHVFPGVLVMGIGMGFTFVPLQNLSLLGVAPHDAGAAAAAANAANQVGGSIGLAVVTTVYVAVTGAASQPDSARAAVEGYSAVFLLASGFLVAAAVLAVALVRKDAMKDAAENVGQTPVLHIG